MEELMEYYLPSSDRVHQVHVCLWVPEQTPKGVIQLAHGISEYATRYDEYARVLNRAGYVVTANDHLGHGLTATNPGELGYPGERGAWLHMVDDMHRVYLHTKQTCSGLPYVLLGHSMGSFLARSFLIRYPGAVDGCILSGTGQVATPAVLAGALVAEQLCRKGGGNARSNSLQQLCFGSYNRKIKHPRTQTDWISRDEREVDRYIADPLCGAPVTAALVQELMYGLRYIWQPNKLKRMETTTPIYLYSGTMDPVGDYGKGVEKVAATFGKLGFRDVTVCLYEGARHELHNELNREEMFADTIAWLDRTVSRWKASPVVTG